MKNDPQDALLSMVTGKRVIKRLQVDGPQEGHVLEVDTDTFTAYVTMTNSVFGTDRKFKVRYGRNPNPPQNGDLALVEFVGQGVDRGWLVSWTPA